MTRKLTTEQYKEKLKKARGNEVTLLSEYNGSTKPIKVRFNVCGHEVVINKPFNLLNGSKCIICKNKKSRLTTAEFKKRIKKSLGNSYQLVGEYKTSRTKVTIKHLVCGREYKTYPKNALDGLGCPYCSKKAMWSTDKFKNKLTSKFGNEYEVLGTYTGMGNRIKIKHTKCGYVWEPTPDNLLRGRSHCPKCTREKKAKQSRLSYSVVQQRVSDIFDGSIILLRPKEYKNMETMLHYKCLVCGYIGSMQAKNMLQGHGCPMCANSHRNDGVRLNKEYIKKRTQELTNGAYEYVGGDYQNSTSIIQFKHRECGTKFSTTWNKFSQGAIKCPHCRGSRGEQLIKGYLDNHHVKYQYGYVIPDLIDKRNLHFDFWLPQYQIAIEYDGIQHYKETQFNFKNTDDSFKITKYHDHMKNKYCQQKKITLLRLPYYENVNEYLDREFLPLVKMKNNQLKVSFKEASSKELKDLMENYHYLHRRVPIKYGYGLYIGSTLAGMITYTVPNKTTVNKSFGDNATIDNTLELSRLYIKDGVSQSIPNITSKFVSWSLRQLKKHGNWYIISFADSGMHHVGAIYQATNFLYCGTTSSSGEYAWGGPNLYRERWAPGVYYRYLIQPSDKYRYITFVGGKSFKKHAKKELKFELKPYPKQDNQHYQVGDKEERLIKDRETGKIYREKDLIKKLELNK